ncbi:MAG: D-alanine--D-alanine ligase [bacterium]|nr:D-alanine--D-alanine ligase [bacterium]
MNKLRVGVLRGGPSSEYDVSLKTGAAVLQHMPEQFHAHDIFISKDGIWHKDGFERSPDRALSHIDVVFNALHGEFGEDGKVQKILDHISIPYTGSKAYESAIGMNKVLSKIEFEKHGIKTPQYIVVRKSDNREDKIAHVNQHFLLPVVVKPAMSGSSVGITIVKNIHHLEEALARAFAHSHQALIEEYIRGKEATCGVVDQLRGEPVYTLLPVEIIHPKENEFFDYDAKYSGKSQEICPGRFSQGESAEIQRLAKQVHQVLGLRHYSRTDMMVTPTRGIYVLEVNTLPGLTPQSLLPQSLAAVGVSFKDFLHHLISMAAQR